MLSSPFPYPGNKRRWAEEVWSYLGDDSRSVYSEPFLGSAAMLLASPVIHKHEIVCDTNGFIANFWRALREDPEQVAYYADWPKVQQDLEARHIWLMKWGAANSELIKRDCDRFDPKAAGYWAWGQSIWIRGGWCLDNHRESIEEVDDKRPAMTPSGVSPDRLIDGVAPDGRFDGERLWPWFRELAARLARVAVLNRSWESAVTGPILKGSRPAKIFLDPPYRLDTGRKTGLYQSDLSKESTDIATQVYEWAVAHGEEYAIAYAMHEGDFVTPPGWELSSPKGFGFQDRKRNVNGTSDIIMYSPVAAANRRGAETKQMQLL